MKKIKIRTKIEACILVILLLAISITIVNAINPIEETDEEIKSLYAVSFPTMSAFCESYPGYDYNFLSNLGVKDMTISSRENPGYGYNTVFSSGARIYKRNINGDFEHIVALGDFGFKSIRAVANGLWGDWIVFTYGDTNEDVFYFQSTKDLQEGKYKAHMENVETCLIGTICEWGTSWGNRGFIWGEYSCISDYDCRIIRVVFNGATASFNTELTVDSSIARHFHGIDPDTYNPGTFYAYMGDTSSQTRWFKSNDNGDNWELVDGSTGAQTYRTLRLHFTPDYIYWATDGFCDNGYSQLLRANRSDIGNPEILANLSTTCLSYGSCLVWEPYGILVTLLDNGGHDLDKIPMYFYDLRSERLVKIFEWNTKDNYRRAGVHSAMPYQDLYDGVIWLVITDVNAEYHNDWENSKSIWLTKGLMISRVMY